jgi:hypothetical protein
MLTPEDLEAQLKTYKDSTAREAIRQRLTHLPPSAAAVGLAFFEQATDAHWYSNSSPEKLQNKRNIDALSASDRAQLFAAFFPSLHPHIEAAWQLQIQLPVQWSWFRRAFRAPHNPEYTLESRLSFFDELVRIAARYRYDLDFLICLAPHIGYGSEPSIGILLAAILDSSQPESQIVYDTLVQIINGTHPTARIGRYAISALLCCSRPEAWEHIERLLLAAQRQEGLRQVILESADVAHPGAFLRFLHLIHREKLSRFAAVARALSVWFALQFDSEDTKLIDSLILETIENLEDPEARDLRIRGAKGQSLYVALMTVAFTDVNQAIRVAAPILQDAEFERRYAALLLLVQFGAATPFELLRPCLNDPDLRFAYLAAMAFGSHLNPGNFGPESTQQNFTALAQLLPRVPKDKTLAPAIWPWNITRAKQSEIAERLVDFRAGTPLQELVHFISALDARGRSELLRSINEDREKRKTLDPTEREVALSLVSDASNTVRQSAFTLLENVTLTASEAPALEALLSRKASDLRRGAIRLLLSQPEAESRASIARLEAASSPLMRKAAEEISSQLQPTNDSAPTMKDGLGLYNPADLSPLVPPRADLEFPLDSPNLLPIVHSLADWLERNRELPITFKSWNEQDRTELLGNIGWFDKVHYDALANAFNLWWAETHATLTTPDSIELARAAGNTVLAELKQGPEWIQQVAKDLHHLQDFELHKTAVNLLRYHLEHQANTADLAFLLNVAEVFQTRVDSSYSPERVKSPLHEYFRYTWGMDCLLRSIERIRQARPEIWTRDLWQRYWQLLRWIDIGSKDGSRKLPDLGIALAACRDGLATDADLIEQLFATEGNYGFGLHKLSRATSRKNEPLLAIYPPLREIADKCRERILQIELERGDLPSVATVAARSLGSIYGAALAARILHKMGKEEFVRGYRGALGSKADTFSYLLRVCLPLETDTPELFTQHAKAYNISQQRLVHFALYALQWASYAEHASGIEGLADAAHWLHAHTKDPQYFVSTEIRELWFAEVSERTPLSREELMEGAVDVAWFHRMHARLSEAHWRMIFDAAKLTSSGAGHKRAQRYASAIAGENTFEELAAQVDEKRNLDLVRAIGLLPLPKEEPLRRQQILLRYEALQRFLRQSKQFGSQRQASEKLAVSIGMANLARTAGYSDPQRLSWAMESEAVADLKLGPVRVSEGAVTATLSINSLGEADLAYERDGKPLKDLPAALRKSEALSTLRARKTQLKQQLSRMRLSLEEAMIAGDSFSAQDLEDLAAHPLLQSIATQLVFLDQEQKPLWYQQIPERSGPFRIAHPLDLYQAGTWPDFQRQCLESARVQAFKQVFRELYVLTAAERAQKTHSSRYEGQQVNPKTALALLGSRGWINVPEQGIRRTFHQDKVSVWVHFLEGWFTAAEVDGLTVEHVSFTNKFDGKSIPLDQVNPRLFSEAMRDLDLMVSVAFRGDVDPEASASTIEMRGSLLKETLRLLKIKNVRLKDKHAFIDGKLGNYNLHLGSGVVHRQPGGSLCIIPVHSQHRGRLFLPFADNDPKTAEILSKVLLLAQDDKIQDPTILEQLR